MTCLTLDDAGTDVALSVGEILCIELPETPTTGFRWHIATVDPGLLLLDEDGFELSSGRPGAGGVRRFDFRAVAPGTTPIELQRRRRWEITADPEYSFRVVAHVSVD